MRYKTVEAVLSQQTILDHLLLRLKELEKEVQMYRRVVGGGLSKKGAIAAVEGEATLDLTGVIPDSAYPNALLLDASRVMLANIKLYDNLMIERYTANRYRMLNHAGSAYVDVDVAVMRCHGSLQSSIQTSLGNSHFYLRTYVSNTRHLYIQSYDTTQRTCIDLYNGMADIPRAGDITLLADKKLVFTESTVLTPDIAGGITVLGNNVIVETRGGAGTDDLDTIAGGTDGMIIVLRAANDARTIVCRDGVGNLSLAGGVNFSLDSDCDTLTLWYDGTAGLWLELSRSDNA